MLERRSGACHLFSGLSWSRNHLLDCFQQGDWPLHDLRFDSRECWEKIWKSTSCSFILFNSWVTTALHMWLVTRLLWAGYWDWRCVLGLTMCTTVLRSPESNGMAEDFVKIFKRDYVTFGNLESAQAVLKQLPEWFTEKVIKQVPQWFDDDNNNALSKRLL